MGKKMSTRELWGRRGAAVFAVVMGLIALNTQAYGTLVFLMLSAIIFQLVEVAEILRDQKGEGR